MLEGGDLDVESPEGENTLHPNCLMHGKRRAHNQRSGRDVAEFLAAPTREYVYRHLYRLLMFFSNDAAMPWGGTEGPTSQQQEQQQRQQGLQSR